MASSDVDGFLSTMQQIQLQQRESMERMDLLRNQHLQWQAAVEELLKRVDDVRPQVSCNPERPMPAPGESSR